MPQSLCHCRCDPRPPSHPRHHPTGGSGEPHSGQPSSAGAGGGKEGEGGGGGAAGVGASGDAERAGAHEHLGQQCPPHGHAEAAAQAGGEWGLVGSRTPLLAGLSTPGTVVGPGEQQETTTCSSVHTWCSCVGLQKSPACLQFVMVLTLPPESSQGFPEGSDQSLPEEHWPGDVSGCDFPWHHQSKP